MIQRRRGLGLSLKTGECLRILGHLIGQELEYVEATKPGVLGFVHLTHASATNLFQDAVMRDGLPAHVRRT